MLTFTRKEVFAKQTGDICIKSYLKARFQDTTEKVIVFSDGNILRPIITWSYIENLMTVLNKGQVLGDYVMYVEDGRTIEVLRVGMESIAFSSAKSPEEILSNYDLRNLLSIAVFEKVVNVADKIHLEASLKQNGYKVIRNKMYVEEHPHFISMKNGYFSIQNPVFQKDIDNITRIEEHLNHIVQNCLQTKMMTV